MLRSYVQEWKLWCHLDMAPLIHPCHKFGFVDNCRVYSDITKRAERRAPNLISIGIFAAAETVRHIWTHNCWIMFPFSGD